MSSDDSLGLAAVNRGFLTPSQLMEANSERVRTGTAPVTLEKVLLDKGWLTAGQIADLTGRCPLCGDMVSRSRGDTVVRHRCTPTVSATDPTLTPATAGIGSRSSPLNDSYADTPRASALGPFALRYEILIELGAGGMGRVYKAKDRKLDRIVALKKFTGDGQSPEAIDRFTREARTAARLAHPNIVQVHDIDVFQGTWYLTMDFILGRSLLQVIDKKSHDRRRLVEMVHQSAEAIHYAHAHQVIHRDIKPSNILIDEEGRPHVADFGLAKEVTQTSSANPITMSGALIGTPHYMSPEQAAGHIENVNEKSDVYSLGATLYHVLTGKTPIRSTTLVDVLNEVINIEPVSPSLLDPSIPRDLETITLKAMAKDPAQRYATAKDFADDVGRFLRGEAILARAPSMGERIVRRLKKNKLVTSIVAVACIALAVVAATGLRQYKLRQDEVARQRLEDDRRRLEKERRSLALPIIQAGVDRLTQIEKEIALVEGSSATSRVKIDGVLAESARALEIDPDSAHAYLLRGRAFALLGRFSDALHAFTKAIDLNPNLIQARAARARLHLDLHFMPVSLPRLKYLDYRRAAAAFPRPDDDSHLKKALDDFAAMRAMPAVEPDRLVYLDAVRLFVDQDFAGSRTKLEEYLKTNPADAQAWFLAGQASFFLEQWKPSTDAFEQVIRLSPGSVPARLWRGCVYQLQFNFGKSLADLSAIRKMDVDALGPEYPMTREKLIAMTYLAEGLARYLTSTFSPLADAADRKRGWESILKLIEESVALDDGNYLAYYLRARVLSLLERFDDSMVASQKCITLNTDFANAWQSSASAYYQRAIRNKRDPADLAAAEERATRALAIAPTYTAAFGLRATIRYYQNRFDEAAADALDGLRNGPDSVDGTPSMKILQLAAPKVTEPAGLRRQLVDAHETFAKGRIGWFGLIVRSGLCERLGDIEGAYQAALAAAREKPNESEVANQMSDAARLWAKDHAAEVTLLAKSEPAPVARHLILGLSRAHYEKKDYSGADQLATEAIAVDPKYANGFLWRAHARHKLGRWADSLADYDQVVKLVPTMKATLKERMDEVRKKLEE